MFLVTFERFDKSVGWTGGHTRWTFSFHQGGVLAPVCESGHTRAQTLTPVEVWEGTERDPMERSEPIGAALCEWCCFSAESCGGGWPNLTQAEMRRLWAVVAEEQVREALRKSSRQSLPPCTVDDVAQALAAALEQPRPDQSPDGVGKVA